jgi:hypothetical protein
VEEERQSGPRADCPYLETPSVRVFARRSRGTMRSDLAARQSVHVAHGPLSSPANAPGGPAQALRALAVPPRKGESPLFFPTDTPHPRVLFSQFCSENSINKLNTSLSPRIRRPFTVPPSLAPNRILIQLSFRMLAYRHRMLVSAVITTPPLSFLRPCLR